MLTKNDIKALRCIWFSERQILFIQKYVKNAHDFEWLDKESSLMEIIGLKAYNDYLSHLSWTLAKKSIFFDNDK